jgi:glycosyltransferase involved in cell wall biosynthesis
MEEKNKLKIGVNGRFLTKPFTGIGRYTINLFANLARQHDDLEIFIVTPEEPANWVIRTLGPKVRIVVLPEIGLLRKINAGLSKSVWEKILLGNFFRKQKVDLIHLPYPGLFKPGDVPVVMTLHDTFPWTMEEYRNRNFLSGLYNGWTLKTARSADCLLAVSDWSRQEILKLGGFEENKVKVVANACEFGGVVKDEAVLKRFGLKEGQYLFYMGGYDRRKNVQRLVTIFEEYISPRSECKLVLGGGSVLKNNLFEKVRIAGADGKIVQTGFLENHDLQVLYSQARAYISLTTAEGFNLPLLEALSTQCVAIVSDLKVHREVAADSAFYLDLNLNDAELGERIVALLNDKKEYNSLKEKAEKFTSGADGQCFSWSVSAQKTAGVYKKLLQ